MTITGRDATLPGGAGFWSAYPARTRPGRHRWVPATAGFLAFWLIWWVASGLVAELYLPNPWRVAATMLGQVLSGVIWTYLWPTLSAALLGCALAICVAVTLGIVIAHSRPLASVLEPFVAISQTVPLVAIAPLLVLWIGYGTIPIAILCAIVAFFPMVTTTIVGLRNLDMRVVENAVIDGASGWQLLRHVELPMAAASILAGIRGGVVLSMTGAVVGEFVMGGEGLGTLLTLSRQSVDTPAMFATVAWIALTALTLHFLVHLAERAAVARIQGEQS